MTRRPAHSHTEQPGLTIALKTISVISRLRKSSSPSRWLMGLPPTSPRLKFTHAQSGGSPMPRRPPRHPPSPSSRSRSLELLDQDEEKLISPVKEPEVQARPRSRSLDGLLDEDDIVPEMKTEELLKPDNESKIDSRMFLEALDKLSDTKAKDSISQVVPEKAESNVEEGTIVKLHSDKSDNQKAKSNENQSPIPVPRQRLKIAAETKSEPVDIVEREDVQKSSSHEVNSDKERQNLPTRPPKPNRFVSVDTALASVIPSLEDEKNSQASSENIDPCDNTELKERLVVTGSDKLTLLKAKSCGAGLDSDESISSNEYKSREQGSLLSLPTGAEPKRKKNFMDKCVNKMRSFMRK